jgi:hypothetical protein
MGPRISGWIREGSKQRVWSVHMFISGVWNRLTEETDKKSQEEVQNGRCSEKRMKSAKMA